MVISLVFLISSFIPLPLTILSHNTSHCYIILLLPSSLMFLHLGILLLMLPLHRYLFFLSFFSLGALRPLIPPPPVYGTTWLLLRVEQDSNLRKFPSLHFKCNALNHSAIYPRSNLGLIPSPQVRLELTSLWLTAMCSTY